MIQFLIAIAKKKKKGRGLLKYAKHTGISIKKDLKCRVIPREFDK